MVAAAVQEVRAVSGQEYRGAVGPGREVFRLACPVRQGGRVGVRSWVIRV